MIDVKLPVNADAERFVLGSVLLDNEKWEVVGSRLEAGDFHLAKHRLIFGRIGDLRARSEPADMLTLANELIAADQMNAIDGLGYLVTLTDGIPDIANIDAYIRIVKEKSIRRRVVATSMRLAEVATQEDLSVQEILEDAGGSILSLATSLPSNRPIRMGQIIEQFPGGLDGMVRGNGAQGIPTGYPTLDTLIGGFQPGQLIIIAARPAMGKTALAVNIATNMGQRLKKIGIFSLEMTKEELYKRALVSISRVDSQKFRAGTLNSDERFRVARAASDLDDMPIFIDDSGSLGLLELSSKIKQIRADAGGLDCVFIDYLQLMKTSNLGGNRNLELGELTRGLKIMAKDLEIPMVLLSQLSRGPEGRAGNKPMLADLRESGNIEQDADVVMFPFREEVYKPQNAELRGLAELIIGKQRNGPTDTVDMVYLKEFTRFESRLVN